ncbi:MAG TPA: DNA repair protein RecN [Bacillales bacterium]|nr:DNA repair protein RecN [Bacillales bacterium]
MLAELSIKHFGIIESIQLSFENGLTVITGETGAGKSMIIDAIGLLAGGRGSADFVRHGASKAELEGLFFIEADHPCLAELNALGLQSEDDTVVLRREIAGSGKSVCRINGKMVTLSVMREMGRMLIDIHGQHEHQDLLQSDRHLPMLDSFGGKALHKARGAYHDLYESYQQLEKQLNRLSENEKEAAQRLDLIRFQVEEIDAAGLQPGEDEQLESERKKLANFEKVYDALQEGYQALNGEQRGLEWVGQAMSALENVSDLDDPYQKMHESLADSYYMLEEMSFSLRDSLEQLEYDPERLNLIEERLHDIQKLTRKYGDSVSEILQYREEAAAELGTLTNRDEQIEEIQQQLNQVKDELLERANELSEVRKKTAKALVRSITGELESLQMAKTQFDIHFETKETAGRIRFQKGGIDEVEFLISTNPGEPLKPLAKVASGGELSRIMLALKSIFSSGEGVTSIIFDEVDTGVSGRAAQAMAEKIFKLSDRSQVFCITHLPQVAAMADTHLYIQKEETGKRTATYVQALNQGQRVNEIGRMISGAEITDLTKRHAKELLELAQDTKATS